MQEVLGSRPTRARGLKPPESDILPADPTVAPHAGAWIETIDVMLPSIMETVAPHAGAWIETGHSMSAGNVASVAPHAGAWIETHPMQPYATIVGVAPHAGAWIETKICQKGGHMPARRAPRGRVD